MKEIVYLNTIMHTNLTRNRTITPLQTVIAMAATVVAAILSLLSCSGGKEEKQLLFDPGCYPYAVSHGGKYYFTRQDTDSKNITITATDDLTRVAEGKSKQVWPLGGKKADTDIWSPELHYIKGKWYIYFEADDGNTDNHEIYVLENTAATPTEGTFRLKGVLHTNAEWNYGIHPTTFTVGGRQYLVWSGWPKRRSDTETQCIYIASMANPWTVNSERVLISQPTYEWERQWINPDGTRSAYPIYVNENPTVTMSRDGSRVIVYYSASGCWTPYRCEGMVWADAKANLLDSRSWHKHSEPVLKATPSDSICGPNNVCFVPSGDADRPYMLYETMAALHTGGYQKQIRLKTIGYDHDGMPVLGKP